MYLNFHLTSFFSISKDAQELKHHLQLEILSLLLSLSQVDPMPFFLIAKVFRPFVPINVRSLTMLLAIKSDEHHSAAPVIRHLANPSLFLLGYLCALQHIEAALPHPHLK